MEELAAVWSIIGIGIISCIPVWHYCFKRIKAGEITPEGKINLKKEYNTDRKTEDFTTDTQDSDTEHWDDIIGALYEDFTSDSQDIAVPPNAMIDETVTLLYNKVLKLEQERCSLIEANNELQLENNKLSQKNKVLLQENSSLFQSIELLKEENNKLFQKNTSLIQNNKLSTEELNSREKEIATPEPNENPPTKETIMGRPRKLTERDIQEIKKLRERGKTQAEISAIYNISARTLRRAINNK